MFIYTFHRVTISAPGVATASASKGLGHEAQSNASPGTKLVATLGPSFLEHEYTVLPMVIMVAGLIYVATSNETAGGYGMGMRQLRSTAITLSHIRKETLFV